MPLVAACAGSERNALMDMTCGNMANAAMTATAAARSPRRPASRCGGHPRYPPDADFPFMLSPPYRCCLSFPNAIACGRGIGRIPTYVVEGSPSGVLWMACG